MRWFCTSPLAAGALAAPLFTMPSGLRPTMTQGAAVAVYGNSAMPMTGRIISNGQCQVRNNHTAAVSDHNGYGSYLLG